MKSKSLVQVFLFWFSLILFVAITFSAGFFLGSLQNSPGNSSFSQDGFSSELFQPFWQAWDIIHEQYLNQPVDDVELMRGSIRGLVDSLEDPFSSYMDPNEYEILNNPIRGEYTGIGAWVDTSGEFLVIISPMPDSPAEKAGILPEDKVIGIDNEDVVGTNPELVLEKILGPAGSKVTLTVLREGEPEPLEFIIERAIIAIPSVESELLENNIGYIRLYTFGSNSAEEVKKELTDLQAQGMEKLIFDLRNNTGGLVNAAVEITSYFLNDEIVLIEEWPDGTRKEYETNDLSLWIDLPMIVLVNNGTASASEIAAGALQDTGRAVLVGSQTFGKGVIQNWIRLDGENGAIRITIARWLTPNGQQIQDAGLTPDYIIELTEENIENEFDSQLEKAIELITSEN